MRKKKTKVKRRRHHLNVCDDWPSSELFTVLKRGEEKRKRVQMGRVFKLRSGMPWVYGAGIFRWTPVPFAEIISWSFASNAKPTRHRGRSAALLGVCFDSLWSSGIGFSGTCNHAFHFHCISRWLKTRQACPLCNRSACLLLPNSVIYLGCPFRREWEYGKYGK